MFFVSLENFYNKEEKIVLVDVVFVLVTNCLVLNYGSIIRGNFIKFILNTVISYKR